MLTADDGSDRVPPPEGWTLAEAARMLVPLQYIHLREAVEMFEAQHARLQGDAARLEPYRLFVTASRDGMLRHLGAEIERRGFVAMGRRDTIASEPTVIDPDFWRLWVWVDLDRSSVGDGNVSYHAVRVYEKGRPD